MRGPLSNLRLRSERHCPGEKGQAPVAHGLAIRLLATVMTSLVRRVHAATTVGVRWCRPSRPATEKAKAVGMGRHRSPKICGRAIGLAMAVMPLVTLGRPTEVLALRLR